MAGKQSRGEPDTKLNWKKCNFDGMKEFMYYHRWNLNGTVEQDWLEFKNVMAKLVAEFVPKQKILSKQRPKWLTAELLRLIRKKKRVWKVAKNYNAGPAREEYNRIEKEVAKKIKNAKKNMKKTWHLMRIEIGKSSAAM
jgi:hypothetical protein